MCSSNTFAGRYHLTQPNINGAYCAHIFWCNFNETWIKKANKFYIKVASLLVPVWQKEAVCHKLESHRFFCFCCYLSCFNFDRKNLFPPFVHVFKMLSFFSCIPFILVAVCYLPSSINGQCCKEHSKHRNVSKRVKMVAFCSVGCVAVSEHLAFQRCFVR